MVPLPRVGRMLRPLPTILQAAHTPEVKGTGAWLRVSRRPGYQCRESLGSGSLFQSVSSFLSPPGIPLAPLVDPDLPNVLPSNPACKPSFSTQCRHLATLGTRALQRQICGHMAACSGSPSSTCATISLPRCDGNFCAGAVSPDAHWVQPVSIIYMVGEELKPTGSWAGGGWLTDLKEPVSSGCRGR